MTRRGIVRGILATLAAGPATAAEAAQRRRQAAGGKTSSSNAKPGVAERANRRVGRATQGNTANAGKNKAEKAGTGLDSVLGRKRARR